MGRIVAIAGGNLESTHKINQYIVALAGREKANLLFIGTASHDAVEYIEVIHTEFESLGCDVKELNLTSEKYTDEEIDELLDQADIIYVGGGDTAFMVNAWREYGLDSKLKKVYLTDRAVLSGISAGAMCWSGSTVGIVTVPYFGRMVISDMAGSMGCLIFIPMPSVRIMTRGKTVSMR